MWERTLVIADDNCSVCLSTVKVGTKSWWRAVGSQWFMHTVKSAGKYFEALNPFERPDTSEA